MEIFSLFVHKVQTLTSVHVSDRTAEFFPMRFFTVINVIEAFCSRRLQTLRDCVENMDWFLFDAFSSSGAMLSIALGVCVGCLFVVYFFTAVFSFDLNGEMFLVWSVFLHGTLIVTGCAEQLFTVFLPAIDVNIFHSLGIISLTFGLDLCC